MNIFSLWREKKLAMRAQREAEALCRRLFPEEPVINSGLRADEPSRYVVIVYYGHRTIQAKLPLWKDRLVVAIDKDTFAAEPIEDSKAYLSLIR